MLIWWNVEWKMIQVVFPFEWNVCIRKMSCTATLQMLHFMFLALYDVCKLISLGWVEQIHNSVLLWIWMLSHFTKTISHSPSRLMYYLLLLTTHLSDVVSWSNIMYLWRHNFMYFWNTYATWFIHWFNK